MATNAVYKIYNGSSGWVDYHFKTNAAQVIMTNARKFITNQTTVNGVAFTLGENDYTANVTINGTHISGAAAAVSGSSLQYIAANDTIAVALGKLDKAAKDAYDKTPASYIKNASYDSSTRTLTLTKQDNSTVSIQDTNTTYESKAAASGGSAVSLVTTGEKYTWNNMVPNTRTVNGKPLSSNIELAAADIKIFAGVGNSATVSDRLTAIDAALTGNGKALVINVDGTFENTAKNAQLKSTANDVTISFDNGNEGLAKVKYHAFTETTELVTSFSVGDVVYIKQLGYPDRWVSAVTIDTEHVGHLLITFSKLETYNMAWEAISGKPSTLGGYGITDAKIENGVITLGSNTIQPLTSLPSHTHDDYLPLSAGDTKPLTGTLVISAGNALNKVPTIKTTSSYPLYLQGYNGLKLESINNSLTILGGNNDYYSFGIQVQVPKLENQETAQSLGNTWKFPKLYTAPGALLPGDNTFASREWVDGQGYTKVKVTASDNAPTNPSTGDIWIDTNN